MASIIQYLYKEVLSKGKKACRLLSLLHLILSIGWIVILIFICFWLSRPSFLISWWSRCRTWAWSRPGLLWGFWSRSWLGTGLRSGMPGRLGVWSFASWWVWSWSAVWSRPRALVAWSWMRTRSGMRSVFRSGSAPWSRMRTWSRSWAFL